MAEEYSTSEKVYSTENPAKLSINDMLAYFEEKAQCASPTCISKSAHHTYIPN